jgi:hypothetical protein
MFFIERCVSYWTVCSVLKSVSYWTVCSLLNGMFLIERYVPYWTVCSLLNGMFPIERYVPCWRACFLLNGMFLIEQYVPSHLMYRLRLFPTRLTKFLIKTRHTPLHISSCHPLKVLWYQRIATGLALPYTNKVEQQDSRGRHTNCFLPHWQLEGRAAKVWLHLVWQTFRCIKSFYCTLRSDNCAFLLHRTKTATSSDHTFVPVCR